MVQLLGIVGELTGDAREEVVRLGAMQTPQALRTDPKRWTGLKEFATAAAKTDFVQPSSVANVAANDSQADAFMAEHGSPILSGKHSQYVRRFVRRKRLRSMLSALVASSDAATAASFWAYKCVKDLSEMVPDMSDALASMPQGMAALDAARLFQLSIVTGPLLLSMAACFWKNALKGKFGGVAREAARHEEALGLAYEAYFKENGINASVPVLMGTQHVAEALAKVETAQASSPAPPRASDPAPQRASDPALSQASSPAPPRASDPALSGANELRRKAKGRRRLMKSKAKGSKDKARKGNASAKRQRGAEGNILLNQ